VRRRPGQAGAGAARCTRGSRSARSARSSAGDSTGWSSAGGRAGRRLVIVALRGITSVPARMSSATSNVRRESRAGDDEPSAHERPTSRNPSRTAPRVGGADRGEPDRRGALLATAVSRPSPPSTSWRRRVSPDRAHRGARDWQRYGGMERCVSPEARTGPGAGAGGDAAEAARARAGELDAFRWSGGGGRPTRLGYASVGLGRPPAPCGPARAGSSGMGTAVCTAAAKCVNSGSWNSGIGMARVLIANSGS
jgi:hypothetical protein